MIWLQFAEPPRSTPDLNFLYGAKKRLLSRTKSGGHTAHGNPWNSSKFVPLHTVPKTRWRYFSRCCLSFGLRCIIIVSLHCFPAEFIMCISFLVIFCFNMSFQPLKFCNSVNRPGASNWSGNWPAHIEALAGWRGHLVIRYTVYTPLGFSRG